MTTNSALFLFLVFVFFLFPQPNCHGGTEEKALAKIKSLGGQIKKDVHGNVTRISLTSVNLFRTNPLTDGDVESIDFAAFPQLSAITVDSSALGSKITARTVLHLSRIPSQLESLTITGVNTTDEAMVILLKKQRSLLLANFRGTSIKDVTLRELATLEELSLLILAETKITDKGLKDLSKLDLYCLSLSQTDVSDVGMAEISKMKGLLSLSLDGTKVTDAGILKLGALPNLRSLDVSSTRVTEDGKRALQKLIPDLKFRSDAP